MTTRSLALIAAICSVLPGTARAHWCDCLWASRYNIVVRPAVDTIAVPQTGSGTLDIWVENNMGYPLTNYGLVATAPDFTITVSIDETTRTRSGYLLPGERLRHTLWITRAGGTGTLDSEDLSFYVAFGGGVQDDRYGSQHPSNPSRDTLLLKTTDNLAPASPSIPSDSLNSQARHLISSIRADYGSQSEAIVDLFNEYCVGRHSWGSGDPGAPVTGCCPDPNGAPDTTCPVAGSCISSRRNDNDTKWDYQHLWAAGELAYRKDQLSSARLQTLRDRLRCGQDDAVVPFKVFALFLIGYIGDGSFTSDLGGGTASSYLQGLAGTSSTEGCAATAALLAMGESYQSDANSCLSGGTSNAYARIVCAAALNMRGMDSGNNELTDEVINRVAWRNPEGDDATGLFAAHVLNLVAWHFREGGAVGFYQQETVAPPTPSGLSCALVSSSPPVLDISWSGVTDQTGGGPGPYSVGYRVYWGTSSGNYVHSSYTLGTSIEPPDLASGTTYYFTVATVDNSVNASTPAGEISCNTGSASSPPVADISCTPTSGDAPLHVDCNCTGSSDSDGDINHCYFSVDGGSEQDGLSSGVGYDFSSAGTRNIQVRVTDTAGNEDTDSVQIQVNAASNEPPNAVANATPTSGPQPLNVGFSSAGSSDPDGTIVTYAWDFDDSGSSGQEDPNHTFASAGVYDVTLTVTDNDGLTGSDVVRITVTDPPTAVISCTPTSGVAPQHVDCDCDSSTDPSGDINHCYFAVDGGSEQDGFGAGVGYDFSTAGTRNIQVRVTDAAGNEDTDSVQIQVNAATNEAPSANAAGTPTSGDWPLNVTFSSAGSSDPDGSIASYAWDFDDGGSSTDANPSHTFAGAGVFDVTLTVTDDGSPALTGTDVVRITVTDTPVAVISCTPTAGQVPLHVDCDCDSSTDAGGDINHCWFSVDAGTEQDGFGSGMAYDFDTAGSRTIVLRVTDATGNTDTDSLQIQVNTASNQAPSASAWATPTSGDAPLLVAFSSTGSTDPDGTLTSFLWDFDTGSSSTEANPSTTFAAPGNYDVTLEVADDGGLTGTDVVQITVTDPTGVNQPPDTTNATVEPQTGVVPFTAAFDASTCTDPDDDTLTYSWTVASVWTEPVELIGATVEHTFTEADLFTVTLTLTDDGVPPRQVRREFEVLASDPSDPLINELVLVGSCACRSTPAGLPWLLVFVGFALRFRSRVRR
jgi:PKD repeat protein